MNQSPCKHDNHEPLSILQHQNAIMTLCRCNDCKSSFYNIKHVFTEMLKPSQGIAQWDFHTALGDTIKKKYAHEYVNVIERQDVILRQPIKNQVTIESYPRD